MKLVIDLDTCEGCESCVEMCPDAIEMGDDGKAHVIGDACSACDCDELVGICPVEAISTEE
ncbi:MAG: ferredoxin [Nitrospirota bacterium]|jgi:ferredoxin